MHAYHAYRQHQTPSLLRVDLILTIYDGILRRLQLASQNLSGDPNEARRQLDLCQVAIAGLASGACGGEDEVAVNFTRLYEFALHCLAEGTAARVQDAIGILTTLRDSFQAIRAQALEMERNGHLPPLDREHRIQATA